MSSTNQKIPVACPILTVRIKVHFLLLSTFVYLSSYSVLRFYFAGMHHNGPNPYGMHRIGNGASTETTNISAQDAIDYIATNMKLRFDVLSMQTAQITLFNNGPKPIKHVRWALYGCTLGVFDAQNLGKVTLTHINGCLYKFEPTEQFQPIAPGASVKFQFGTTALQVI